MSSNDRPALAGFAFYAAVALLPLAASLLYGGLYSVGIAGLLAGGPTLAYWRQTLGGAPFWSSLGYSLYIAVTVAAVSVAIALGLAFLLRERLRRGFLQYALLVPMALPGAVAGFTIFQMLTASGLLARLALRAGVIDQASQLPPLTNDLPGIGIIAAHLLVAIPFFTLLFAQIAADERLVEYLAAARTLGAGPGRSLWMVGVPMILRGSLSNICLFLVVVMGSYEIPLLLGRQSPEMLSVLTLRKYAMYDLGSKPEAFVVALLYTLVTGSLVIALAARSGQRLAR